MLLQNFQNEKDLEMKSIREGFGDGIVQAASENKDVVVLNADLPGSLKLEKFMQTYPKRFFQIGVAEQNMAGIGTGFELGGKIPFITSFAAFSPGLNFSQIRLACIGHQNIKIVGSHYGLNAGQDGPTAQMESDMAMMKALPGMIIVNPADYNQAIQATLAVTKHIGPAYLRVTREKFPIFINPEAEFEIGKAQVFLEGKDITVIATGSMVYESLMAVEMLVQEGISVEFINLHTVKPIDREAIVCSAQKTGKVVTIEEHNVIGGMGESVASVLAQNLPVKMKIIGIEDRFGISGKFKDLWERFGLDRMSLSEKIRTLL